MVRSLASVLLRRLVRTAHTMQASSTRLRAIAAYAVDVTKRPELAKRTLGQLIPVLAALPASSTESLKTLVDEATKVNEVWIKVKHGDDPLDPDLLRGLRATKRALEALQGAA